MAPGGLKTAAFLAILAVITPAASASSIGSFPVKSEKKTDSLDVSFKMRMFNTGERDAIVRFSTPSSPDYNVSLPGKIRLEAEDVTQNPTGSGYYHLGDGKYVKLREVSFQVEATRGRTSNSLEIPINVRASLEGAGQGETTANVVYVQQHLFKAEISGREIRRKGKSDKVGWVEVDEKEEENRQRDQSKNQSRSRESYKPGEEKKKPNPGFNATTFVLLAIITALAAYIYRVY